MRDAYRRAFADLATVPRLLVLLVAETRAIARGLRALAGPVGEIIVCPYVGGYLDELGEGDREARSGRTVGFVGQTREVRGAHLIPEIARRTLAERPDGLSWRVQLDLQRLADWSGTDGEDGVSGLIDGGRFEIVPPLLSTEDYFALLRSIDVMVMPYSGAYRRAPSGVATECLRTGCVQVVPAGSTMARIAKQRGAGYVAFQTQTADAVAAAVIEALHRFEELQQRSKRAAEAFFEDGALQRIVQFVGTA